METTTTTQSIELFKTALLGQNYSPKTLRAYSDDLKQFMQWVGENRVEWDNPRRFTRADVEGFMSYLAGQNMTGITRVRKLAAIRKLFTFMEENRIIAGNRVSCPARAKFYAKACDLSSTAANGRSKW
jgi:site-specific recombinase XerD